MTKQDLHNEIKARLETRTTEQLISDAKEARANKADESSRLVFALIMDTLATRMPEAEWEELYETITA